MAQRTLVGVCLLAVCGGLQYAASRPTIVRGPPGIVDAINRARNEGLPVTINEVVESTDCADDAFRLLESSVGENCAEKWNLTVGGARALLIFHGGRIEESNFDTLLRDVIDRGLAALDGRYPEGQSQWEGNKLPWSNEPASNLAALLWETSKTAGCAYTTDCPRVQILACVMKPTLDAGVVPFSKEYFDGLVKRNEAPREKQQPPGKKTDGTTTVGVSLFIAGLATLLSMVAA